MPDATFLPPTDALSHWHEFYMLGGTASATMVGLLFVAASVGAPVQLTETEALPAQTLTLPGRPGMSVK